MVSRVLGTLAAVTRLPDGRTGQIKFGAVNRSQLSREITVSLWKAITKTSEAVEAIQFFDNHPNNQALKVLEEKNTFNEVNVPIQQGSAQTVKLLSEIQCISSEGETRKDLKERTLTNVQSGMTTAPGSISFTNNIKTLWLKYKYPLTCIERGMVIPQSFAYLSTHRALQMALHEVSTNRRTRFNLEEEKGRAKFYSELETLNSAEVENFIERFSFFYKLLSGSLTEQKVESMFDIYEESTNQPLTMVGLHAVRYPSPHNSLTLRGPYFVPSSEMTEQNQSEWHESSYFSNNLVELTRIWKERINNDELEPLLAKQNIIEGISIYPAWKALAPTLRGIGFRKFAPLINSIAETLFTAKLISSTEYRDTLQHPSRVPLIVYKATLAFLEWEHKEKLSRSTVKSLLERLSSQSRPSFLKAFLQDLELQMLSTGEIEPTRLSLILYTRDSSLLFANEVVDRAYQELSKRQEQIKRHTPTSRTTPTEVSRDIEKGDSPITLNGKAIKVILDTFVEALHNEAAVLERIQHPKLKEIFHACLLQLKRTLTQHPINGPLYEAIDKKGPGTHSYNAYIGQFSARYIKEVKRLLGGASEIAPYVREVNRQHSLSLSESQLQSPQKLVSNLVDKLVSEGILEYPIIVNPWFNDQKGKWKYLTKHHQEILLPHLLIYSQKYQTHTFTATQIQKEHSWIDNPRAKQLIETLHPYFVDSVVEQRMKSGKLRITAKNKDREKIAFEAITRGTATLYHYELKELVKNFIKCIEEESRRTQQSKASTLDTLIRSNNFVRQFLQNQFGTSES